MKKVLIWIKDFILHFIRRVLQIIFPLIFTTACSIIYLVTFEPHTRYRATPRKARRIRVLTKFKLYLYKWFKPYFVFTHDKYFEKLYNRLGFLIEKK
jgi:hypothetical protein